MRSWPGGDRLLSTTSIPAVFEATLSEIFEQLNRPVERRGNLWIGSVPVAEVDRFVAGRTVTLRAGCARTDHLFQDVERLLREAVRNVIPDENPSTRWLMAAAVGAGVCAASCFGLLVYALSLIK